METKPVGVLEERKLVTVLFADLAQSTALFVGRDAEQVRAMLGAFFEEMAREVRAFGGTVEKYAGDSLQVGARPMRRWDESAAPPHTIPWSHHRPRARADECWVFASLKPTRIGTVSRP
jgi:class 3 adenylate cyclase